MKGDSGVATPHLENGKGGNSRTKEREIRETRHNELNEDRKLFDDQVLVRLRVSKRTTSYHFVAESANVTDFVISTWFEKRITERKKSSTQRPNRLRFRTNNKQNRKIYL